MSSYKPTPGYESDLKYDFYFPENACMNKLPATPCRHIPYPLENIPTCKLPCRKVPVNSIYNDAAPSELFGDALGMNEGTGMFYYHDPTPYPIGDLTVPQHPEPYHHNDPQHS